MARGTHRARKETNPITVSFEFLLLSQYGKDADMSGLRVDAVNRPECSPPGNCTSLVSSAPEMFGIVGAKTRDQRADYGGVIVNLGLDEEIERKVRDIVRVETQLLWAHRNGLDVPAYALKAFRDAADLYRERGAYKSRAA